MLCSRGDDGEKMVFVVFLREALQQGQSSGFSRSSSANEPLEFGTAEVSPELSQCKTLPSLTHLLQGTFPNAQSAAVTV